VRTDYLADDFRSKMVEMDVPDCLVDLLQDGDASVHWPSIEAIATLVKFGRLIYHFLLCED
jgi:hypothetical protein